VEVPLLLQFSIALFTGMVAATLVPPVRRAIPREVEVLLWVAFLISCAVGVVSVTDKNARELTSSALWGIDQLIHTAVGLAFGGALGWISDHRFAIATWVAILAGADLFVLAVIGSVRSAQGRQPKVRLGEWMEMPLPGHMKFEPEVAAHSTADLNRRVATATAVAGARLSVWLRTFTTWTRDVLVPQETQRLAQVAAVGRVESRAQLESLRDTAALLQFAARSWYAAAAAPMVAGLASKASGAARLAVGAGRRAPAQPESAELIDIQALLSAQSIGWYGPMIIGPSTDLTRSDQDGGEAEQSGRLAS
jgi:hypothetical protein